MAAPPAVRDAALSDAPAVAEIYAWEVLHGTASFEEEPPSASEIAGRMAAVIERGLPWLVAEADGVVAGYAYASPFRARSAYRFTLETSVYVARQAHRRGVGRALLTTLVERCAALGYRQLIAAVGDSANAASILLHEACGFRRVGAYEQVGIKFGRALDVVLMQRGLDAQPG